MTLILFYENWMQNQQDSKILKKKNEQNSLKQLLSKIS